MKYLIKKTYAVSYKALGGHEAWLRTDTPDVQVWMFRKEHATPFDQVMAERLMAEAKRNRPDDVYELVPIDS